MSRHEKGVRTMDNMANIVTISVDEYFDLRSKAEMNATLLERLAQLEARFIDFDRRLWEVEHKCAKS